MTGPKHDLELIYKPSDVAKFIVGLLFTVGVAVVTAYSPPVTISGVLQLVTVGVGALLVYPTPYNVAWFKSAKVYLVTATAVLTALVPLVATYVDTGAWHNLAATEWVVVVLAVGKAFGVSVIPNTEPFRNLADVELQGERYTSVD